jgi:transposase-like protein
MTWDSYPPAIHQKALDLYSKGNTAKQVGITLQLPKSTVLLWVHRAGLPSHKPKRKLSNRELRQAHAEYINDRLSAEAVGRKYGMSLAGILKSFRRAGLRIRGHGESLELDEWTASSAVSFYRHGLSVEATGRRLGISPSAVNKLAHAAGVVRNRYETRRRVRPAVREQFWRMVEAGRTKAAAGRTLGLSAQQTWNLVRSSRAKPSENNRAGGGLNVTDRAAVESAHRDYVESGDSLKRVAARHGLSATGLTCAFQRLGLPTRSPKEAQRLLARKRLMP